MKAWTEIFDPNYRFSLAKVSYQREQDIQDTAEIKVNDNTDIHIEQDHAYLSLSREIKFQPDGLFSLLIEFDAELTYTESYRAVIGESLDDEEKEKITRCRNSIVSAIQYKFTGANCKLYAF